MTKQEGYAKALHMLVATHPERAGVYLENLKNLLKRSHHEKLLPKIFIHYETIEREAKRMAHYRAEHPQANRTRALVELYRTLIATN